MKVIIDTAKIKYLFQKLFRGFSDEELRNLEDTFYLWLYPRLKAFRRKCSSGHPMEFTAQEWEGFLKRSQRALETYLGDNEYRGFKKPIKMDWKKTEKELKELCEHISDLWD